MKSRPGFALPLVVLMSLVAALLVAFALDRATIQALGVNRQVERYANHHFTKGIETLIESFTRSISGRQLSEVLDETGLAMQLLAEGSPPLNIRFFDAQNTFLEAFDGLSEGDRMLGEGALVRAIEAFGVEELRAHTRKFGPLAVSVNSSSEAILRAALDAALLGDSVDRTLNTILQARRSSANGTYMTRDELALALDSAGLEPPMRARVERVLTAQPVIWRFEVEPDQPASSAGGVSVRYVGLAIISPPNSDRGANIPKGGGSVMEIRKIEQESGRAE
jgi:hypothetical protein